MQHTWRSTAKGARHIVPTWQKIEKEMQICQKKECAEAGKGREKSWWPLAEWKLWRILKQWRNKEGNGMKNTRKEVRKCNQKAINSRREKYQQKNLQEKISPRVYNQRSPVQWSSPIPTNDLESELVNDQTPIAKRKGISVYQSWYAIESHHIVFDLIQEDRKRKQKRYRSLQRVFRRYCYSNSWQETC